MTSSIRNGTQQNYSIQEYKSHNPFMEPDLVSILFLSCGKHKLAKNCFERLVASTRMYSGELEWIFAENGQDADNLAMYKAFNCERKKIIDTNRNWGINCAFNDMHRISRGEFVVEMENDWWATDIEFDWITRSLDIMRNDPDIGIVQLRSIWDSNENWGIHKKDYNIWSVGGYSEAKTESGHSYLYAKDFYAYNHNPNLSRKVAIESILPLSEPIYQSDLRNGEGEAQKIFRETHWKCAHINRRLFEHVGGSLRKQFER